jgi:hypothetical protein
VALCRNRGIPARLVGGLVLGRAGVQTLHYWAEAWVGDEWLPACPTHGWFGTAELPENYLVLWIGDGEPVRGRGARFQYHFEVHSLAVTSPTDPSGAPSGMKAVFRKFSLYALQPAEQHLVRFLVLLPPAALIVCVFRTLVGMPTFGTFGPALLGLAFLDLRALPFGLVAFVLVVCAGWRLRRLLDDYHLLLVPRVSALLTMIVMLLIVTVAVASRYGVTATQYIGLFPLVILTHLVERFWTVEVEDSTAASFKTLLGTIAVTVVITLALSWDGIARWLFRYPEGLGLVLAAQLLLGRYTGYRLSELYRFQDLIVEEPVSGETHELADQVPAPAGPRRPGDEPAEHGVHPRPESTGAVPPGGPQAADA